MPGIFGSCRSGVLMWVNAGVYYVIDSNVPGLHAEGDTLDELRNTIISLAFELLVENGIIQLRNHTLEVPLELVMQDSLKSNRARC